MSGSAGPSIRCLLDGTARRGLAEGWVTVIFSSPTWRWIGADADASLRAACWPFLPPYPKGAGYIDRDGSFLPRPGGKADENDDDPVASP
jgi:hypothetical protein